MKNTFGAFLMLFCASCGTSIPFVQIQKVDVPIAKACKLPVPVLRVVPLQGYKIAGNTDMERLARILNASLQTVAIQNEELTQLIQEMRRGC